MESVSTSESVAVGEASKSGLQICPGLRLLDPNDHAAFGELARHIGTVKALWDDHALYAPVAHFLITYAHPESLVFDLMDGGGMAACVRVIPGWRAMANIAIWEPRALRCSSDILRAAIVFAMEAKELLALDALVDCTNRLSVSLCRRLDFVERGIVRGQFRYAGVPRDMIWFELTRAAAGLETRR